ncbi:carbonic anhydrase [Kytococcus aerolatus]|uniref:carbonic anhydrase n=1 Tax=Kytococcus aerolatus TaxID=592308 RepID=A0A212T9E2_9MICO|nr:carbonic anhydrase [Kytococcus aerolatus]SNC62632.1 carbonic anhydrase [Kytococcus aerolatus]
MNAPLNPTPTQAWETMLEGNARFVADTPLHPNQDAARRASQTTGQAPFATVFGCADSRVAAEMIFDRGLGDLFVTRTAGQVMDSAVLGSLEFGAHALDVPLLVVLGHDSCGAVKAGLEAHSTGELPPGHLSDIVQKVTPSVLSAHRDGIDDERGVMERHVAATVELLPERSRILAERVEDGRLAIVGAAYDLADGSVRVVAQQGL